MIRRRGIKASRHQGIEASRHQGIEVSKGWGVLSGGRPRAVAKAALARRRLATRHCDRRGAPPTYHLAHSAVVTTATKAGPPTTYSAGRPAYYLPPTTYWGGRGFTLVEVLVVIGILVVLFNLLMVPMMMGLRLTSSTRSAVESQDMARGALEQMKKDVARAMLVLPDCRWETTSLVSPLLKADTTMNVFDARNFPAWGSVMVGLVPFGAEVVFYASRTDTTLDGLTRGLEGTIPVDHSPGSRVLLVSSLDPTFTPRPMDEFVTSRLDLIMPKTDSQGRPIHPLTPDPRVIRYYIAPARVNVGVAEGWPKYWNRFLLPSVGVVPTRGNGPHLYALYRVRFNLDRLSDPTYMLQGCDPWMVNFHDDPNPSPVAFGPQVASYSFWWRRLSTALTPLESTDAALYAWKQALGTQQELRPLERALPTGEVVAAPGFTTIPARRDGEELVPNDRDEPTTYSGSLSLWAEWPAPTITLSNGNPPAGQEFWTVDLNNGSVDFALSRTECFDDGAGVPPPPGDGALVQDPDAVGAYNVYQVSMSGMAGLDRGGPTDALGNPIPDFVIIPGSEKIQVIDSSGNISDYTREAETDPLLIQLNGYHVYRTGRITFIQGFNDPAAGATNDIIIQFQYRRNLLRDATGNVVNDSVLAAYSSLAQIDVRLALTTYSHGRAPVDEFRVSSRLEVGNAPR